MKDQDDETYARALLAGSLPFAEVAKQLGYSNYQALASWCQRRFGRGPREIRTGEPPRVGRSRGATLVSASATWQTQCTEAERAIIVHEIARLVEQWGCSHGAALARALAEAGER